MILCVRLGPPLTRLTRQLAKHTCPWTRGMLPYMLRCSMLCHRQKKGFDVQVLCMLNMREHYVRLTGCLVYAGHRLAESQQASKGCTVYPRGSACPGATGVQTVLEVADLDSSIDCCAPRGSWRLHSRSECTSSVTSTLQCVEVECVSRSV